MNRLSLLALVAAALLVTACSGSSILSLPSNTDGDTTAENEATDGDADAQPCEHTEQCPLGQVCIDRHCIDYPTIDGDPDDTDVPLEGEAEATESETPPLVDGDADTDGAETSDAGSDADSDADSEQADTSEAENTTDGDSDSEAQSENETESAPEADAESDTLAEAEAEVEAEAEAEAESEQDDPNNCALQCLGVACGWAGLCDCGGCGAAECDAFGECMTTNYDCSAYQCHSCAPKYCQDNQCILGSAAQKCEHTAECQAKREGQSCYQGDTYKDCVGEGTCRAGHCIGTPLSCSANGRCDEAAREGKCTCQAHFAGTLCDQCTPQYTGYPACNTCTCQNGGRCYDAGGGSSCICAAPFAGPTCESCDAFHGNLPACDQCLCQNGGSCTGSGCSCVAPFGGTYCGACARNLSNYPACNQCAAGYVNPPGCRVKVRALHNGWFDGVCALTTAGELVCQNPLGHDYDFVDLARYPVADPSFVDFAMSSVFLCVLTDAGGVLCRGSNVSGVTLGDGSSADRLSTFAPVTGLSSGVAEIQAGFLFTCALKTDSTVWCWGVNDAGQLGDGTTISRNTPVQVAALGTDTKRLVVGGDFACVQTKADAVKCWGGNSGGQLGDGTHTNRSTPAVAYGLDKNVSTFDMVASGHLVIGSIQTDVKARLCAVVSGSVKCFDGGSTSANTMAAWLLSISSLAVSESVTCVLTSGGGVKCYGKGGLLGNGKTSDATLLMVDVDGMGSGVTRLKAIQNSAVKNITCASINDNGVDCWGSWNDQTLLKSPAAEL